MNENTTQSKSAQPGEKHTSSWGYVVLALVAAGFLTYYLVFSTQVTTDGREHAAVGRQLAELNLEPLTATTGIDLAGTQGKVTLINYWGPWCYYCRLEFPHLVELEQKFRRHEDFLFVSVSSSGADVEDDIERLRTETAEYLAASDANFSTYVDTAGTSRHSLIELAELHGFGYPTTVLVDRDGVIRGLWLGYVAGYEAEMEMLVAELLAR